MAYCTVRSINARGCDLFCTHYLVLYFHCSLLFHWICRGTATYWEISPICRHGYHCGLLYSQKSMTATYRESQGKGHVVISTEIWSWIEICNWVCILENLFPELQVFCFTILFKKISYLRQRREYCS